MNQDKSKQSKDNNLAKETQGQNPGDRSGKVQGEGDYEAARRYNSQTTEHAQSGAVEQQARDAEPGSRSEARDLERAENKGRERAKDEDPLLDEPERISREGMAGGKSGSK